MNSSAPLGRPPTDWDVVKPKFVYPKRLKLPGTKPVRYDTKLYSYWSAEEKRQALDIMGFPSTGISDVGAGNALQFILMNCVLDSNDQALLPMEICAPERTKEEIETCDFALIEFELLSHKISLPATTEASYGYRVWLEKQRRVLAERKEVYGTPEVLSDTEDD